MADVGPGTKLDVAPSGWDSLMVIATISLLDELGISEYGTTQLSECKTAGDVLDLAGLGR